jgi:hypothetical protein
MTPLPPPEALARLVSHVMETMLTLPCELPAPPTPRDRLVSLSWRAALLPIPGSRPLTIALASDQKGCLSLSAALFACEESSVDAEMIDDTLRELVNMIGGQVRTAVVGDQALGLPRIDTGFKLDADLDAEAASPLGRCIVMRVGAFEIAVRVAETQETVRALKAG